MRIHPFEDGNKRCAKIILASNLLKSFCAPIIITEEDTKEYYQLINNCDYEGFAEFLRQRSKLEMDTLVSLFKMKYNVPMDETPDVFKDKLKTIRPISYRFQFHHNLFQFLHLFLHILLFFGQLNIQFLY